MRNDLIIKVILFNLDIALSLRVNPLQLLHCLRICEDFEENTSFIYAFLSGTFRATYRVIALLNSDALWDWKLTHLH